MYMSVDFITKMVTYFQVIILCIFIKVQRFKMYVSNNNYKHTSKFWCMVNSVHSMAVN